MVLAVLATRAALESTTELRAVFRLALEVLAGAVAYVFAALLVARSVSRELYSKLRVALRPQTSS